VSRIGDSRTAITVVAFVLVAKGLAFLREAFVAYELGASASSDAYYLAFALPIVLYNLLALPFSLWVTARLTATVSEQNDSAAVFYRRALMFVSIVGALLALGVVAAAATLVTIYAPGLTGDRIAHAASVTRIGALAIPALAIQAVSNGKSFARGRFTAAYAWLALSGLVGVIVVIGLTPRYGPVGAVSAFVASAWTAALGGLWAARAGAGAPRPIGVDTVETDFGVGVVYRAAVMQVFFQGSLLLTYAFGSGLPPGEIAASLFGSKVQVALYETLVVTAGVLVYPRLTELLRRGEDRAAWDAVVRALTWLLPVIAVVIVLLITCRSEIITLIYKRKAFDAHAVTLVSEAVLGLAPGILGLTLVEMLHRALVLRGRLLGYVGVFGGALVVNWVASRVLVPRLGVLGLTLGSSVGVIAAAFGMVVYAGRRLDTVRTLEIATLAARTLLAAGLSLAILVPLRATIGAPASTMEQIALVAISAIAAVGVVWVAMTLLGHHWPVSLSAKGREADTI
jgi:putative peptidoglycan lipid II flippase